MKCTENQAKNFKKVSNILGAVRSVGKLFLTVCLVQLVECCWLQLSADYHIVFVHKAK